MGSHSNGEGGNIGPWILQPIPLRAITTQAAFLPELPFWRLPMENAGCRRLSGNRFSTNLSQFLSGRVRYLSGRRAQQAEAN